MNNNWKKCITPFDKSYSYEKKVTSPQSKLQINSNFLTNFSPSLREINSDEKRMKDSTKKLRDFVSYFKPNPQKINPMNGNFQIMQKEYENLKGALKRKLFHNKTNTSRPYMRCMEKISESHMIHEETSNLSRTIENLRNGSLQRKKDNSNHKILLISQTMPKNKENSDNKQKTLKKREEIKENQEKTTTFKKNKVPSSTEDELFELLEKSCNTTSNKKKHILNNGKISPSFFLDSDNSSNRKNNNFFDKPTIESSCERTIDRLFDKISKECLKRTELERKFRKSMREMDSIKIKLQFIEEKLINNSQKFIPSSSKKKEYSEDLINCCVTSQKKQNSFDSCILSNIKISEFNVGESNEKNLQTKKINQKLFHLDDSTTVTSHDTKKKILGSFSKIINCLENNKNENLSNLEELTQKFSEKLNVFQKAKEKFNRKFSRMIDKDKGVFRERTNDTGLVFSMTNSNIQTKTDYDKRSLIKNPTFSYSEYNINNLTNFSNSSEKTQ